MVTQRKFIWYNMLVYGTIRMMRNMDSYIVKQETKLLYVTLNVVELLCYAYVMTNLLHFWLCILSHIMWRLFFSCINGKSIKGSNNSVVNPHVGGNFLWCMTMGMQRIMRTMKITNKCLMKEQMKVCFSL